MRFWIENGTGARFGHVELPEVRSYADAPQHVLWMSRLFYLQAADGGGYAEGLRPRLVSPDGVKVDHPSAIEAE